MHSFLAPASVTPSRSVEGLTLAMDYRSDALAVWERSGTIYARELPESGRSTRPAQRVATAAPGAHLAALLSDDDRAILAWSETRRGISRVFAELSASGVSFGTPRLLERYADPGGLAPPPPRLVRLVSESVMLAWTGAKSGHWVVRTAAIDLNGVRAVNTISTPGHNALLADLASGPAGEAYALWSEPLWSSSGGLDLHDRALYGARGIDAYPGRHDLRRPRTDRRTGHIRRQRRSGHRRRPRLRPRDRRLADFRRRDRLLAALRQWRLIDLLGSTVHGRAARRPAAASPRANIPSRACSPSSSPVIEHDSARGAPRGAGV